jgi:hypothetical protein
MNSHADMGEGGGDEQKEQDVHHRSQHALIIKFLRSHICNAAHAAEQRTPRRPLVLWIRIIITKSGNWLLAKL